MNVETLASPEVRASVHGALADPSRVRIVDRLVDGDAAPSELQELVGLPSNLLAHHLRVLERCGLVTRQRSEADRRRWYLHLVPGPLVTLCPRSITTAVRRVVFVCTANSARSILAASLWACASPVPAISAGTHPAARIAEGAVRTARKHGLALTQSRPQLLSDVLDPTDFVIAVCDNAYERLSEGVVRVHWSVPDPVRVATATAFDAAHDDLAGRVTHLAQRLQTAS